MHGYLQIGDVLKDEGIGDGDLTTYLLIHSTYKRLIDYTNNIIQPQGRGVKGKQYHATTGKGG